jgi:hypothetical protein
VVLMSEGRVLNGVVIDGRARIQHCRSCGALIWWGKTQKGKACPFDVVDGARTAISHFSTCRDAQQWSRRGDA